LPEEFRNERMKFMSDKVTSFAANQDPASADKLRGSILAINILYAAACLLGFTAIIGVVLAYMRRNDTMGTVWEGHVVYAIRTFWLGLAMIVVGTILLVVGVGFIVLALAFVWYAIRIVRSFLAWSDAKPIGNPRRFF
jgi:uncharacterized membrane protein